MPGPGTVCCVHVSKVVSNPFWSISSELLFVFLLLSRPLRYCDKVKNPPALSVLAGHGGSGSNQGAGSTPLGVGGGVLPPSPPLQPCARADKHQCGCEWVNSESCRSHADDGSLCWTACCCPLHQNAVNAEAEEGEGSGGGGGGGDGGGGGGGGSSGGEKVVFDDRSTHAKAYQVIAVGGSVYDAEGILTLPCTVRVGVSNHATGVTEIRKVRNFYEHVDVAAEVMGCDEIGGPFMVRRRHLAVSLSALLKTAGVWDTGSKRGGNGADQAPPSTAFPRDEDRENGGGAHSAPTQRVTVSGDACAAEFRYQGVTYTGGKCVSFVDGPDNHEWCRLTDGKLGQVWITSPRCACVCVCVSHVISTMAVYVTLFIVKLMLLLGPHFAIRAIAFVSPMCLPHRLLCRMGRTGESAQSTPQWTG